MSRWGLKKSVGLCLLSLAAFSIRDTTLSAQPPEPGPRPNVLWVTCEDISPNLGCFGDAYAVTPNLDRLAAQGVRYTKAYAPIGVCAPSRSSLITGMYAPSLGTQHMRCEGKLPDSVQGFPYYLRQAGYYCTNNVKTDYNFRPNPATWDESSGKAHWRHRRPGQPFFSVFNFTSSHESQIRLPEAQYARRTADFTVRERHDPDKAPVPPYLPDTPEVRRDWARYYDMITFMDRQAGEILHQLEADGLAEDTIVFFFSDHGAGMPRSKRWLYESSTHVPMIVRFPAKYAGLAPLKAGSTCDRLLDFTDLGPTVLSLLGVPIPPHMQGKAFLGAQAAAPRAYVYGFRDRMDERYDMLRSVFDGRYRYIHNYMPQLPWFHDQYISYMYEMPTMRVWQRLADEGKLRGSPAIFMARSKPTEELYDTEADPSELHNLSTSSEHQEVLKRLRRAQEEWREAQIDLSYLPEADLRTRFGSEPPYSAVRAEPARYPIRRIAEVADQASAREPGAAPKLAALLKDEDPAVRYWAAMGLGALGSSGASAERPLREALGDPKGWVRVAAADALCRLGHGDSALPTLVAGLRDENEWVRLQAVNVLDRLDARAQAALPDLEQALKDPSPYVVRVAEHAVHDLKREKPGEVQNER